ncbi:MAG: RNA polymerase sigma factor [Saccharofermentanales bacterium]
MPNTDDVKLAIEASKGNTDAFERLVELYFTGIVGVCYSITGNAQDAEDCAQDAFVKAYRNIGRYDASASFFTWIYRIAINTCYDLKRKQNRTQSISIDEAIESDDGVLFLQLEDMGDLPDQQMIKQISDSRIQEIIDSLPEKYSRIIRLKDIEGMSYQEIAQIENIKEGTVKSRLARARVAFAKIALEEDLYE